MTMRRISNAANSNRAKIDALFHDYTEVWHDALYTPVRSVWSGLKPVVDSVEEMQSLCYYRALMAWLNDDPQSLLDRRRLMAAYLLTTHGAELSEDTLVRMLKRVKIDSEIPSILRRTSTAYDLPPERTLSQVESTHDILRGIYNDMQINGALRTAYHRARLCGMVAVRPEVTEGQWSLAVMTPDQFRITTDAANWRRVTSITYPYVVDADRGLLGYVRWTETAVEYLGPDGKPRSADANLYGVVPWVVMYMDPMTGAIYPGGLWKAVEAQMNVNSIEFDADVSASFAGAPVWMGVNLGTKSNEVRIGPDKVLMIDDVTAGEGQLTPPELMAISPEPSYSMLSEHAHNRRRTMQHSEGVPVSMTSNDASGAPPSGVARLVERAELTEMRLSHQEVLASFEQRLAEMVATVANVDAAMSLRVEDVDVSITYAEEAVFLEPEKEYVFDRTKVIDGVMDPVDYLRKWGGVRGDDAVVVETFEARRELARTLGFTASSAPATQE